MPRARQGVVTFVKDELRENPLRTVALGPPLVLAAGLIIKAVDDQAVKVITAVHDRIDEWRWNTQDNAHDFERSVLFSALNRVRDMRGPEDV